MSQIAVLNGLLGMICGLRFRVQIFIPLMAVAFGEVALFKWSQTWPSTFWLALILVLSLEMGYLVGVGVAALWATFGPRRSSSRSISRARWSD
jgi:hypothetical protein